MDEIHAACNGSDAIPGVFFLVRYHPRTMKRAVLLALLLTTAAVAEVPSNLVVENVPEFPPNVVEKVKPYLDFRTASLRAWHPTRAEILIGTRFADVAQLHIVKMPGGDRRQITFYEDPVGSAGYLGNDPNQIVFAKDVGGGEFYQFYRMNLGTGEVTLLTDGKSRNVGGAVSRDDKWFAYSSTKRTGNDTDVWIMDPLVPGSAKMVMEVQGGGWFATDFSRDGKSLLVSNYISANESEIYRVDLATGAKTLLTPKKEGVKVAYSAAQFSADDSSILFTTDDGSEFQYLVRMNLADGKREVVARANWDVDSFTLSHDRSRLAYVTNENGVGVLHLVDLTTGKALPVPKMPLGVIGGVEWHRNNRLVGLTVASARTPSDVYSIDTTSGSLTRWTESETGGLNPERNVEPELITVKSFDGTPISAFVYRPDPKRFPGKRPAIINIHGGPEGQAQPGFGGRNNYFVNELGIAFVVPNVRGSSGYGKTFLAMDNGYKREDSVKDIGAIIDWINADPALDGSRIAVRGGSYGGYMVLASMTHFNDRLRAGVDIVGVSSFLTFLKNTSGYRRDLRRVEYGDERDPKMNEFLGRISPLTNISKITKPLFVIMGFNDPRVPYTEGEQVAKAVRANGAPVWFLMAKDEGHGFAKRKNQDYEFIATVLFLQEHLLK